MHQLPFDPETFYDIFAQQTPGGEWEIVRIEAWKSDIERAVGLAITPIPDWQPEYPNMKRIHYPGNYEWVYVDTLRGKYLSKVRIK